MKESYIYSDGAILVDDYSKCHFGIQKREYQDTIEKILETENIIEGIENIKKNYKESIRLKKKEIKHNKKKNISIISISIIIGIILTILNPFDITYKTALLSVLISSGSIIWVLSPTILSNLKNNKEISKEIKGLNLATEKANRMLIYNEELLEKLKSDKSKSNEDVAKKMKEYKKINYISKLQELKSLLSLYCTIGVNEKEFREYYEKCWLDSKLEKNFSESDIKTIKSYFCKRKTK